MARRTSDEGVTKLKGMEGEVLYTYDDADPNMPKKRIKPGDRVRGKLTIGFGHTGPDVAPGMTITKEKAEALLRDDLSRFEKRVESLVKVPLTDHQFDALVSFDFNTGQLHKSTLLKELNKGNYEAVPHELMKWVKTTVNGKKLTSPGLVNRRAAEAGMWAKGAYVASNTVEAEPRTKPIVTKEGVAATVPMLASLGWAGQLFEGSGPVQWAVAGIIVAASALAVFWYIRSRGAKA